MIVPGENAAFLDKIDHIVLKALLEDGRASYSAIAKEAGLTDVAIKKRVDSLKRKGILSGIVASINYEVLGFRNPLYVQIRSDISQKKDLLKKLKSIDYVAEIYEVLGEYNFLAKLILPDVGYANQFIKEMETLPAVKDIKTMVVVNNIKNSPTIPMSTFQKRL